MDQIKPSGSSSSSSRVDRKTIEKNRRDQMKTLFTKLNSLVTPQGSSSKEVPMSLPDQVDEAIKYIKKQQASIEKLKERRNYLLPASSSVEQRSIGSRSPQIKVHENGSTLEVNLITGLDSQFIFNETIRVLHEEGVEVVHASFYVAENSVFHTVHAMMPVGESGAGNGAARISERLKKFAIQ